MLISFLSNVFHADKYISIFESLAMFSSISITPTPTLNRGNGPRPDPGLNSQKEEVNPKPLPP